jgi:hypothetical protein
VKNAYSYTAAVGSTVLVVVMMFACTGGVSDPIQSAGTDGGQGNDPSPSSSTDPDAPNPPGAKPGKDQPSECTECPKGCFDLQTDAKNCGSCGLACPKPEGGGTATCVDGQCGSSCAVEGASCGTVSCCSAKAKCVGGECCTPNCPPDACGDDGCGGSCGGCPGTSSCRDGRCCLPTLSACVNNTDCCGAATCDLISTGSSARHCCLAYFASCTSSSDCCTGNCSFFQGGTRCN